MSGLLPDWDGASLRGTLPEWAVSLSAATGGRYTFATMQVHDGRAVVAVLTGGGAGGPLLVVCRDEDEMRHALGLKPRKPS